MKPILDDPDGRQKVEIARLTTRRGKILMIIYGYGDGTFGYTGEGCGGSGFSLEQATARLNDAREWPGGKTAVFLADTRFFGPRLEGK